jgi:hypothetical protein
MTKTVYVLFAVVASVILLTQISAYADYSEARKLAKEREKMLLDAAEKKRIDKIKKELTGQKKALDSIPVTTIAKVAKGKAAADASNTAKLTALNAAQAAYDAAKTALDLAEKAHKMDKADPAKKQAFLDAQKAFEKAKIDKQLAKFS